MKLILFPCLITLCLICHPVVAAPSVSTFVGGSIGFSHSVNQSFPASGFVMDLNLGHKIAEEMSTYLGGFFLFSVRSAQFGQDILNSDEILFLLGPELTQHNLFNTGLYVGARLGIGNRNLSKSFLFIPVGSDSFFTVAGGPTLGYDLQVNPQFLFGLNFSLLYLSGGAVPRSNSSKTYLDPDLFLSSMLTAKFLF